MGEPVQRERQAAAQPTRAFRVLGASVLLAGALGGTAFGADYTTTPEGTRLAVDSIAPPPAATAAINAQLAATLARKKAQVAATAAAAKAKRANNVATRSRSVSSAQPRAAYPVPSSCGVYTGNRALGCALLLDAGFGLEQMPCLKNLWDAESGWNPKATNPSSGAYGIPQALPASKLAAYGADWQTNPVVQITWGLNYIKNRYQNPCGAWAFFQSNSPHWY